jgi:hypothetical protein
MQQVCLAQSTLLLFPLWPVCGRGEVAVSSLNISVGCNWGSRISVISVGSALVGKHDYAWHAMTIGRFLHPKTKPQRINASTLQPISFNI